MMQRLLTIDDITKTLYRQNDCIQAGEKDQPYQNWQTDSCERMIC